MLQRYFIGLLLLACSSYGADIQLWVDDSSGVIGKVNVVSGAVSVVGNSGVDLTDIAFAPNGNLYGITFGDLYQINSSNGAASLVGPLSGSSGQPNSLVFGSNGTLYMAGNNLYTINPASGQTTSVGAIGYTSGGDLAFVNGTLYLSTANNQLVKVNTATGAGTSVGQIGVPNVFGLASPGNGVLYGVAGTSVYTINTSTGAGTLDVNYGGQGLGTANGEAFITEALPPTPPPPPPPPPSSTPEPASWALLGLGGLLSAGLFRRKAQPRS